MFGEILKPNIMENIKLSKKGKILTITVDLEAEGRPSTSGKSLIIATSKGSQLIEGTDDLFMGLNILKKGK